jgi:hypothetical protein
VHVIDAFLPGYHFLFGLYPIASISAYNARLYAHCRAIAQTLKISPEIIEKHRANLMSKLNVYDLAGLIRAGIKHGLILLDE